MFLTKSESANRHAGGSTQYCQYSTLSVHEYIVFSLQNTSNRASKQSITSIDGATVKRRYDADKPKQNCSTVESANSTTGYQPEKEHQESAPIAKGGRVFSCTSDCRYGFIAN